MGWVSNDDHDAKMVPMNWLVGPDKSFQTIFHVQQMYNGDHDGTDHLVTLDKVCGDNVVL